MVKESEAISYSYERKTEDPRISHSINMKIDEYGNVLESAAIVYPRMLPDLSLPTETRDAQAKTVILYTHNQFTNDHITDDAYLLRLPSEVQTFELRGVAKAGPFYTPAAFDNILSDVGSDTAGYHEIDKPLSPGMAQRRLIEQVRTTYYQNTLAGPLPLHQVQAPALRYESYQLAYTPALVTDIFGSRVNDALLTEGRFTHSQGDTNWWVRSGTTQFIEGVETAAAARARFYVPVAFTDPYGAITRVNYYSNYFLFVQQTEDALGNTAGVERFNFRTLTPQRMRDINGNFSEAISDELGLVKAVALLGKGNEADELTGLTELTSDAEKALVQNFFTAADSVQLVARGKDLLQRATTRFVYDLEVYTSTGQPAVVAAISREQHYQLNNGSPIQIAFEYSNGIGEVLMKKVQAEPGPAKQVAIGPGDTVVVSEVDTALLLPAQLRWIGNGRIIKNNKGNAVKQYEPYFSLTHRFEAVKELVETGVTPLLYYDAAGRLTKTLLPDGSFTTVVFDSWQQAVSDPNDTVLESEWYLKRTDASRPDFITDPKEQQAAARAAKHADTPNRLHFDTLGRPVLSIEHNKNILTEADEFYLTKTLLDAEGNLRSVTDARGNTVMQYKYNLLGSMVSQQSMDTGKRWLLQTILGKPLRSWDERGHVFLYEYDILQRPLQNKVTGGDGPVGTGPYLRPRILWRVAAFARKDQ